MKATKTIKPGLLGLASALLLSVLILSCDAPIRNVIILCAGDSLTEQGYPLYLQTILRNEGIKARVLNYGRSGFTSGQYLDFLKGRKARLSSLHPDLILVQLGTNDVRLDADRTPTDRFEANMRDILDLFRDFRTRRGRPARVFLALIPPVPEGTAFPFSPESSRRAREEINPVLKRLAEERGVPLVDNYSLFVRLPGLLPGVHPTEDGYRELAENWHRALKPGLPRGR